jgi:predicted GTPase
MARYKGDLPLNVAGAAAIEQLQDGDLVLIAEGCTHHRQCDDIGTVKLPRWIREYTGVSPSFSFCSGREFPEDLESYRMVIHCGGCMLGEREMKYRLRTAQSQGVPITNYGILIAYLNGILKRTLAPFPDLAALLDKTDL